MLEKLDALYDKRLDLSIEGLQRLFFSYRYDGKKSVMENCLQVQDYADRLFAEGETVKKTWVMQKILSILPTKLHHFRTAWDNFNVEIQHRMLLSQDRKMSP